jgi:hypothetical protein
MHLNLEDEIISQPSFERPSIWYPMIKEEKKITEDIPLKKIKKKNN